MSIELRIERLVLDQELLEGEHAGCVHAEIERELVRQLAQPGALEALRSISTVDRLPPATARHPREALGVRIAVAVGTSLGLPPMAVSPAQGRHARTWP